MVCGFSKDPDRALYFWNGNELFYHDWRICRAFAKFQFKDWTFLATNPQDTGRRYPEKWSLYKPKKIIRIVLIKIQSFSELGAVTERSENRKNRLFLNQATENQRLLSKNLVLEAILKKRRGVFRLLHLENPCPHLMVKAYGNR